MRRNVLEITLAGAVALAVIAAVAAPLHVEMSRRRSRAEEMPTIELTAVMDRGVWTDELVTAATLRRQDLRPARPVLRLGQQARLRLSSADVVHAFSVPGLGIDPVEVYPGRTVELLVKPRQAGIFEYYCTTVCGDPHFAMRGFLEVLPTGGDEAAPPPRRPGRGYWQLAEPAPGSDTVTRGAWLYRRQGCVTCHGEGGAGGVSNPNSMNATVPALADLARRTFLFTSEDVDAFRAVLAREGSLERLEGEPEVPLFAMVGRQYLATRELVRDGRRSSRLDPSGTRPPLDMPAWGARLSDAEIDAVLEYLLTLGGEPVAAVATDPAPHPTEGDLR